MAGYRERAKDASSVIVQIESAAGISALDDILDVAGIGGIFIGPYDLSASMGYVGRPDAPVVVQAIRNVIDSCRARGVPVGQFFANAQAYKAAESAHLLDFVAIGLDTMLLARSLESQLTAARGRQIESVPRSSLSVAGYARVDWPDGLACRAKEGSHSGLVRRS